MSSETMKVTLDTGKEPGTKGLWYELGRVGQGDRALVVRLRDMSQVVYDAEVDIGFGELGSEQILAVDPYLGVYQSGWVKEFFYSVSFTEEARLLVRAKATIPNAKIEVEVEVKA